MIRHALLRKPRPPERVAQCSMLDGLTPAHRYRRVRKAESGNGRCTHANDTTVQPYDCSVMTTFFRSALGLCSPARVCLRRRSSLTRCPSSIVLLSWAALYTGFGRCRVLSCPPPRKPKPYQRSSWSPAKKRGSHNVPRNFSYFGVRPPARLEALAVLDCSALARGDDSQLVRRVGLPDPDVAVVRAREDETRVPRVQRRHDSTGLTTQALCIRYPLTRRRSQGSSYLCMRFV